MPDIKAVFIDVYRTLLELFTDESRIESYQSLSRWLSYHGVNIPSDELYRNYHDFARELFAQVPGEYPEIDVRDIFTRIIKERSKITAENEITSLVDEACIVFRTVTTISLEIYPQVIETLTELKKSYKLGIVSDTQRAFTSAEFRRFGLDQLFDVIVFSSDVKRHKPHPDIFQKALNTLGIAPNEAVHVGDDLFCDIWGAQQIGMSAIWVDRGSDVTLPQHVKKVRANFALPGHELKSLPSLIASLSGS